jgi:aspartate aminotransferase
MARNVADRSLERSRSILPSSLHEMHRLSEQRGSDVIALHIGEPHIGIPVSVREAFVKAIRDGHSYYCDAPGLPVLREAISNRLSETAHAAVPVPRLFVTPGSCQAIAAVLLSLAFDGGIALMPEIHWPMHLQQVLMAGLKPRFYSVADSDLSPTDSLDQVFEPQVCVLIVNSPANPTGQVINRTILSEIYEWALNRGVWVISDEAYEDFVYEGEAFGMTALDSSNTERDRIVFSVHTFSKGFSMTGYRLGYVAAPNNERAELLRRVQEATLVAPSTPVQFAGLAALSDQAHLRLHSDYVRLTRDAAVKMLQSRNLLSNIPAGGWYAMLDLSGYCQDTHAFCLRLLHEAGVALAPGQAFVPANHHLASRLARIALCQERSSTMRGIRRLLAELEN